MCDASQEMHAREAAAQLRRVEMEAARAAKVSATRLKIEEREHRVAMQRQARADELVRCHHACVRVDLPLDEKGC